MACLIGKKAPTFSATAVQKDKFLEEFSLKHLHGKHVIFFFYPLDFTFVCPTELHAFQEKYDEFKQRGAELVGCSVDSHYSHFAWLQQPKNQGGIQGVEYPIVSDINKTISRDYCVLSFDQGVSYRGLFLIDKEGEIRHQLINDLPLGRSVDEAIRMLDALIFHEKHGEVCPANWHEGEKTMIPDDAGLKKYFQS